MGGTITGALRTAQSGLLTNQSALEAVANNIANVNTEGYSRKDIKMEQRVVSGNGAGVQLAEVRRVIDEGLLKNLRSESGTYEMFASQGIFFERMQEMFGAPGDNRAYVFDAQNKARTSWTQRSSGWNSNSYLGTSDSGTIHYGADVDVAGDDDSLFVVGRPGDHKIELWSWPNGSSAILLKTITKS